MSDDFEFRRLVGQMLTGAATALEFRTSSSPEDEAVTAKVLVRQARALALEVQLQELDDEDQGRSEGRPLDPDPDDVLDHIEKIDASTGDNRQLFRREAIAYLMDLLRDLGYGRVADHCRSHQLWRM